VTKPLGELTVGAIDSDLESLGTGAALNGGYEINCARFNLPGGFARDFRLNLADAEVRIVGKLLRDGLIEEISTRGARPVGRRDEDKGALALRIARRGPCGHRGR
jgi:hypothetical protein